MNEKTKLTPSRVLALRALRDPFVDEVLDVLEAQSEEYEKWLAETAPVNGVPSDQLARQWFGDRNLRPGLSKRCGHTTDADVQSLASLLERVRHENARGTLE